MTLTYKNYSPQAVTCVTNFYGDSGAPLLVPFSQGTVSTRTDVLQPGASIHDQTVANPAEAVVQGWAQASCTGPVQASELFRLYKSGVPIGEASVNAELPCPQPSSLLSPRRLQESPTQILRRRSRPR